MEDSATLFARTAEGLTARADLSWSFSNENESFINIFGTHGTVSIGWRQSRYRQNSSPEWILFGQGYNKLAAFRAQLENFCNAVRGTEPLLITSEDAVASVEVIQAAYQSLASGGWVPVPTRREDRADILSMHSAD